MKKSLIATVLAFSMISPLSLSAEGYDMEMKISDVTINYRETEEVIIPVNINSNNGISGVMARFVSDEITFSRIDTNESNLLYFPDTEEEFAAFDIVTENSVIWSTKDTANTTVTGNFLNLVIDASILYPGVYEIGFNSEKTEATKQSDVEGSLPENANVNWVNGSLTVNATKEDFEASYLIGDVDFDEIITASDALKVLQQVAGVYEMNPTEFAVADNDFDNEITAADALNILKHSTGEITSFKNSAITVGIYLSEDGTELVHCAYYNADGLLV